MFAVGVACHPKPHPETTDTNNGSTNTTATTTTGTMTSDDGSVSATSTSKSTAMATDSSATTDTSGAPLGCGDGIPENDVLCFQEVTFPDVPCERKVAGDLNGDSHLDLAVKLDEKVRILLGNGSGNLEGTFEVDLGELVMSDVVFSAIDIDADGDLDLQVLTDLKFFDLRNVGDGTFAPPLVHELPLVAFPLTLVDVSGDNLPDIVGTVLLGDKVEIRIFNNAGQTFLLSEFSIEIPSCYGSAIAAGVLDGDLLPDVLVASSCNTPIDKSPLTFFRNLGNNTLQLAGMVHVGRDPIDAVVIDLDGDAAKDAVVINQAGGDISIMLGLGDGTFAVESRIGNICPECSMLRSLRVADLDGTGVADEVIVTASVGKPSLRLMTVLNPLATEPTIVATHEAVLSMIEIGDWNEDGVSDIAFSNADLSLGILLSNP